MTDTMAERATHLAHINLQNDQGTYNFWVENAKEAVEEEGENGNPRWNMAQRLKDWHEDNNPCADYQMVYSDLMGLAIGCVDWYEIADGFLELVTE